MHLSLLCIQVHLSWAEELSRTINSPVNMKCRNHRHLRKINTLLWIFRYFYSMHNRGKLGIGMEPCKKFIIPKTGISVSLPNITQVTIHSIILNHDCHSSNQSPSTSSEWRAFCMAPKRNEFNRRMKAVKWINPINYSSLI